MKSLLFLPFRLTIPPALPAEEVEISGDRNWRCQPGKLGDAPAAGTHRYQRRRLSKLNVGTSQLCNLRLWAVK